MADGWPKGVKFIQILDSSPKLDIYNHSNQPATFKVGGKCHIQHGQLVCPTRGSGRTLGVQMSGPRGRVMTLDSISQAPAQLTKTESNRARAWGRPSSLGGSSSTMCPPAVKLSHDSPQPHCSPCNEAPFLPGILLPLQTAQERSCYLAIAACAIDFEKFLYHHSLCSKACLKQNVVISAETQSLKPFM